jgi:hypothetical protein
MPCFSLSRLATARFKLRHVRKSFDQVDLPVGETLDVARASTRTPTALISDALIGCAVPGGPFNIAAAKNKIPVAKSASFEWWKPSPQEQIPRYKNRHYMRRCGNHHYSRYLGELRRYSAHAVGRSNRHWSPREWCVKRHSELIPSRHEELTPSCLPMGSKRERARPQWRAVARERLAGAPG